MLYVQNSVMYCVKHKTTNITNIPRGQVLCSTINDSKALWTCNSSEAIDQNGLNVKHSGLQGGLLKKQMATAKSYLIVSVAARYNSLWSTVELLWKYYIHMLMNINHQATAHAVNTRVSLSYMQNIQLKFSYSYIQFSTILQCVNVYATCSYKIIQTLLCDA